jgi:integrase
MTNTARGNVSRRSNGDWVASCYTATGQRRQLKGKTKAEAQAKLSAFLTQQHNTTPEAPSRRCYTLQDALRDAETKVWRGTPYERSALLYARQVLAFFGPGMEVSAIGGREVNAFRDAMAAKGNASSTINKKVSTLRVMREMAIAQGIDTLPQLPKGLKVSNQKDRIYTPQEVEAIASLLLAWGKRQEADLFIFLTEMGPRFSEAARLRGRHLDQQRGTVTFYKDTQDNKQGNRTLGLTVRARAAIEPYAPPLPHLPVWSISYAAMRYAMDKALATLGLADEQLSIHTARHTCGSRLAVAGRSLLEIKTWLGHRSTAACERYLHLDATRLDGCLEALNRQGLWSTASTGSNQLQFSDCNLPQLTCNRP